MATSQGVLHHDVLLSQYVQHWKAPKGVNWYLHNKLFPVVTSDKASNVFKVINQGTFMQRGNATIGPRGDVNTVQAYYDPEVQFVTKPYGLDGIVDYLEREMADDAAKYEELQTDLPMSLIHNDLELDAWNAVTTTANLGSNYATVPTDEMWDNASSLNANPILRMRKKCESIMAVTGRKVNFAAFDRLALRALKYHRTTQAIAPVHTTPAGLQEITVKQIEEKLQDVMEPGSIHIVHFRYDGSRGPKGQSSLVPKSPVGPNLVLGYITDTSREDISATKQFAFVGDRNNVQGTNLQGVKDVPALDEVLSGETHDPRAPIAAYTYPVYSGQRGGHAVRVLTNRVFKVVRPSSLWVDFGIVDSSNSALYGSELS